jgi:RimJ/RimL family protein N-acetyltransferase
LTPSNITLRNPTQEDLPVFFEHQRDEEANQMAGFPSRDKDAFMKHWARIMADENVRIQTILLDEQVVGNVVSFVMEGQREVGYWIGREFWGKGIASESLRQFLGQETRRPLYAHVVKHNHASRRVLEKCGFIIQGEEGEELILILK